MILISSSRLQVPDSKAPHFLFLQCFLGGMSHCHTYSGTVEALEFFKIVIYSLSSSLSVTDTGTRIHTTTSAQSWVCGILYQGNELQNNRAHKPQRLFKLCKICKESNTRSCPSLHVWHREPQIVLIMLNQCSTALRRLLCRLVGVCVLVFVCLYRAVCLPVCYKWLTNMPHKSP